MPEARIRAITFPIALEGGITAVAYEEQIQEAIQTANEIFGRHRIARRPPIRFTLSSIWHNTDINSQSLLTRNIFEYAQREGVSFHSAYRLMRSSVNPINRQRYGWSGPWNYGGFTVEILQEMEDPDGVSYLPVSSEALSILSLDQVPGEIATYWVPGLSGGEHGITYYTPKFRDISSNNEGIFISYRTQADILAHELGHLLMRAGHCSFEGDDGDQENSAPPTNLMHKYNAARQQNGPGRSLTGGQIDRMLSKGQAYLR